MTPSTYWTFEGFLRGIQANMMALIFAIVLILLARFVILRFAPKVMTDDAEEIRIVRWWVNRGAFMLFVIAIAGFGLSGASYLTNAIPRATLDASGVYKQMDSNIKKP